MARRKNQTRVSLFAFQDIITSVMGILILIVLLLSVIVSQTIEVQQQTVNEVASDGGPSHEEISQLRKQVASMQAQLDKSMDLLNELSRLESEEQIQQNIRAQQERLETLTRSVSNSRATVSQLKSEISIEEGKLAAMASNLGIKELEHHHDQLQSEIEWLTNSRRMMFNFRNLSGKTPWIVDISPTGLQIAEVGVKQAPLVIDHRSESQIVQDFSKWLERQVPTTTHIVLVVKPNLTDLYEKIKELIDGKRTSVGIELVPDGVQIIDPQRGATF